MEQILRFPWWTASAWAVVLETLGPPATRAFILAILTWFLARAARHSIEGAIGRTPADANLRLLAARLVYLMVVAVGGLTILDTFGVPLSTVVTLVGVVGIGVGLALQDILKSFFAGTYLLFERPFRIGDVVSVKEYRGVVETIGIRTTTLRTVENVQILVPNALVLAEIVANRTHERLPEPEPAAQSPLATASSEPAHAPVIVAPRSEPAPADGALKLSSVARWLGVSHGAITWLGEVPVRARQAVPQLRCQLRRFWL